MLVVCYDLVRIKLIAINAASEDSAGRGTTAPTIKIIAAIGLAVAASHVFLAVRKRVSHRKEGVIASLIRNGTLLRANYGGILVTGGAATTVV